MDQCGAVPTAMINAPYAFHANENLAYAAISRSCFQLATNGQPVAAHEVTHLLSVEHVRGDDFPNKPAPFTANHAATDLNFDATAGASPGDCFPFNCIWHNFLSDKDKTFPDGGSAGNASESNAAPMVGAWTWTVVANYRPLVPPTISGCYEVFLGCPYGCGHSPYELAWYGNNATGYEVQLNNYGFWQNYYSGTSSSVLASTGTQYSEYFRVRATSPAGQSSWCGITIQVQCSETQDPW